MITTETSCDLPSLCIIVSTGGIAENVLKSKWMEPAKIIRATWRRIPANASDYVSRAASAQISTFIIVWENYNGLSKKDGTAKIRWFSLVQQQLMFHFLNGSSSWRGPHFFANLYFADGRFSVVCPGSTWNHARGHFPTSCPRLHFQLLVKAFDGLTPASEECHVCHRKGCHGMKNG